MLLIIDELYKILLATKKLIFLLQAANDEAYRLRRGQTVLVA